MSRVKLQHAKDGDTNESLFKTNINESYLKTGKYNEVIYRK
jgi:hypothetical protein